MFHRHTAFALVSKQLINKEAEYIFIDLLAIFLFLQLKMAYLLVWFKNPVGFSLFLIKSCELLTCYRKKHFVACVVTIFICSNNDYKMKYFF